MSLHKLSAGSGYDYLTRQVAALDATSKGHVGLAAYYEAKGEAPGVWVGSGMAGIDGLQAGDPVTAGQMRALFGCGMHPLAETRLAQLNGPNLTARDFEQVMRLGSPFKVVDSASPFQVEVAKRLADLETSGSPIDAAARAEVRTAVGREFFAAEHGREPRDAVELAGQIAKDSKPRAVTNAGYDLTFSPVKSVSTLWAVAGRDVAARIEQAHGAAVADALAFIKQHALFTRTGAGGVRQVEVRGLVAAAFTHRDSRAGDPDLHTHVAVANKVQTLDGKWLAIDGRVLFKAKVAASETYNTALEHHLHHALGVRFAERPGTVPGKRPIREIVGVNPELSQRWSSRRAVINVRRSELAVKFQADHGRPPTPIEAIALAQQATLETRDAKHEPRSLAEQRTAWMADAISVLGSRQAVQSMVHTALTPAEAVAPAVQVDAAWVASTAERIVGVLEGDRATWQIWHVRAEALRQVRGVEVPSSQVDAVVEVIVGEVVDQRSVLLSPVSDGIEEPESLRRSDGASVYSLAGGQRYTSRRILDAEQRLISAAGRRDGTVADPAVVELALLELTANGTRLDDGQADLVRQMAGSGARLQLAIAPAGAGKTTAMKALTRAWTEAGGQVFGLAPSAAAAVVLGEETGIRTDTLAKLVWSIQHDQLPGWAGSIGRSTLVIIDEAGRADTLSLDKAVDWIVGRGGSVRLIGDDQQLAAIGAGGVLRDIRHHRGALELTELHRFVDPAEAAATIALREGDPTGLALYLDRGRVHVGDLAQVADDVFTGWAADRASGLDSIMLAPTRDLVADLNQQARHHRLGDTRPQLEVQLADGNRASVGDTIITRTNDRRLRLSPTDWVKNGDRWTVTAIDNRGRLTVRNLHSRLTTRLPAGYVQTSTGLGYATTVHGAQGVTADSMHGVLTGTESRQQLYTMASRGRHTNHLYLQTVGDGDPPNLTRPETVAPSTPTETLQQIVARDDSPTSATTTLRDLRDPATRLYDAVQRYTDSLHAANEHHVGPQKLSELDRIDAYLPGLIAEPAWPTLRTRLIELAAETGDDPLTHLHNITRLPAPAGAKDKAAVFAMRLPEPETAGRGPLPWIAGIPSALEDDPAWGTYLTRRSELVTQLAEEVAAQPISSDTAPWLPGGPKLSPELRTSIVLWRAATGVPAHDSRPTGDRPHRSGVERYRRQLEQLIADELNPPESRRTVDRGRPTTSSRRGGDTGREYVPRPRAPIPRGR